MNKLNSLWGFVQVVRSGSFVAAAAQLNLSQSAVSLSVSRLEKSLGVSLLKRTTRKVQLTVEGQSLYDCIGDNLAELEQALDRARNPGIDPSGLVRLSTLTTYGRYAILPIISEFLARYPSIDVRIGFHDGGRGLSRQADDLRITRGEKLETGKVARNLCTIELVLVASPSYLARVGIPRKPEELEQHEFLLYTPQKSNEKRWNFHPRSTLKKRKIVAKSFIFSPRGQLIIDNDFGVALDAAHGGLGMVVTSHYCAEQGLRDGSLVRLLPDYEIRNATNESQEIVIQYPRRNKMSQRVRLLLDYLLEKLASRPA